MQEEAVIDATLQAAIKGWNKAPGAKPHVRRVRFTIGHDNQGEDAVYVSLILRTPPRGTYHWADVKPLHDKVFGAVRNADPLVWPYIQFEIAS